MPSPARTSFLRHVKLRNYKSIGGCSVSLAPLTVLVGRNGSGKSNFLDALRFVSDSLQTSLDHAVRERGGIDAVRRKSGGHPHDFSIELELELTDGTRAYYAIQVGVRDRGGVQVKREKLSIDRPPHYIVESEARGSATVAEDTGPTLRSRASYEVKEGVLIASIPANLPPPSADRLFLVHASGFADFRPVYDALSDMGFYNLNPELMKRPQSPDAGEILRRDGSNVASVIARLQQESPEIIERVSEYLRSIVPGIEGFNRIELGPQETVVFRQEVAGAKDPWKFFAMNMSDGTLRALGILVAVVQLAGRSRVKLVGVEEPETALHPAAAGALMDALREASNHTQVLMTTHSPELLDVLDLDDAAVLVVQAHAGTTEIARVDQASMSSIRDHLVTAGELLRLDQLEPDTADLQLQRQLKLFQFE